MLNEMVYKINAYFTSVPDLSNLPMESLPMSVIFSIAGALILGRFTGNLGGLTYPINFSAMFIGTILSNWLLSGIKIETADAVMAPMLFSMAGMIVASLIMIRWLQREGSKL